MESIISNEERCWFCGSTQDLCTHHAWHGTANRKLADKDGLTVRICPRCHAMIHDKGREGRQMDLKLMMVAESAWLLKNNHTDNPLDSIPTFIARYGKNVL